MTYVEVCYRYAGPLAPAQRKKLAELPGHYGILRIQVEEAQSVARIQFDASRLKETEVVHWVRRAGIPLTEKITINQPAA